MTARPRITVAVPSRGRPEEMRRLLLALRHQKFQDFEVVVVADAASPFAYGIEADLARRITFLTCDAANVSRARNHALSVARGEIIAFTDDDAAPEPTWLEALERCFDDRRIGAVGGYVRGPNGVSFQWRASQFDRTGAITGGSCPFESAMVQSGGDGRFPNVVGVNCAYRRQALLDLGGFDENYRYYLDETDMNLRLAEAGWSFAFAPDAQVHHAIAASPVRKRNRTPTTLFEIGASKAYFVKTHCPPEARAAALNAFRRSQRRRAMDLFHEGRIEGRDLRHLMASLEAGLEEGAAREPCDPAPAPRPVCEADRFLSGFEADAPAIAILARFRDLPRLRREARRMVAKGVRVTLIDMRYSPRALTTRFTSDGFWWHRGGLFGRGERNMPIRPAARATGAHAELDRIRAQRRFDMILRPNSLSYASPAPDGAIVNGPLRDYVVEIRNDAAQNDHWWISAVGGTDDRRTDDTELTKFEPVYSAE